jgi:hypothetical protein
MCTIPFTIDLMVKLFMLIEGQGNAQMGWEIEPGGSAGKGNVAVRFIEPGGSHECDRYNFFLQKRKTT